MGQVALPGVAAVTAPVAGVPVALWTEGGAFRVAIKRADGQVVVWDGKNVIPGPRVDESACAVLGFDAGGSAYLVHAGPRSTVVFLEQGLQFTRPSLVEKGINQAGIPARLDEAKLRATLAIDPNGVPSASLGRADPGVRRCAAAASGDTLLVAWTGVDAEAALGDEGLPTLIDVVSVDRKSGAVRGRRRHDTAKNSISNIR